MYRFSLLLDATLSTVASSRGYLINDVSDKESDAAAVVARPAPLARVLLLRRDEEPELRSNAG